MKHFCRVGDLGNREAFESIFSSAAAHKRAHRKGEAQGSLAGRVIAMWLGDHSTRTRISFEAGIAQLGGSTVVLRQETTQFGNGELLSDSARVIGGYAHAIVVRTGNDADVGCFARHAGAPVINGGSQSAHPCQVLSDLFTVYERRETPWELSYCFLGQPGALAWSYVRAARLLGFSLRFCLPETDLPPTFAEELEELGIRVFQNPEEAVSGMDVLVTAKWKNVMDPAEGAALRKLQISSRLLDSANPQAVALHRMPASRGDEISTDVLEGRRCLAFEQAQNRLFVQQAVLEHLLAKT